MGSASPAALDRLKWLGLAAMLADHLGKAWQPLAAWPWHLAGRPALLLFALVIAHRIAEHPARAQRYLPRLLGWGLLAQPAFMALGNEGLNILFTYAAGCLAWLALSVPAAGTPHRTWARRAGAALVLALAAPWVEYGLAGAMLVPVGVLLLRHAPAAALPALVLLCLAGNAPAPAPLLLQVAAVLVLSATAAWALLAWAPGSASRPLRGFLAFYAGHLSALALLLHGPAWLQAGIQPSRLSSAFSSSSTTSTVNPTATITRPVLSGSAVVANSVCIHGA